MSRLPNDEGTRYLRRGFDWQRLRQCPKGHSLDTPCDQWKRRNESLLRAAKLALYVQRVHLLRRHMIVRKNDIWAPIALEAVDEKKKHALEAEGS
jgi:hypothetical protein